MTDQATVRIATQDDLVTIMHLWRHLEEHQGAYRMFPLVEDAASQAEALFKRALDDPDSRVLIVDHAGKPAGMLFAQRTRSKGFSHAETLDISKMVIETNYRGRGYGRLLVEAAEEFARETGANYMTGRVFSDNLSGTGFWEALGFQPRYEERARPVRK
jgi:GNAT superfamily N-acetyltransferase